MNPVVYDYKSVIFSRRAAALAFGVAMLSAGHGSQCGDEHEEGGGWRLSPRRGRSRPDGFQVGDGFFILQLPAISCWPGTYLRVDEADRYLVGASVLVLPGLGVRGRGAGN